MKNIINFISNNTIQISAVNAGIWLSALDWSIKIAFGLPSTIYVCLKIYHEFILIRKKQDGEDRKGD